MILDISSLLEKEWDVEYLEKGLIRLSSPTIGRGNSPKEFIIRKSIKMDSDFFEGVGLYVGDGKLSNDQHHLDFSSVDIDLVEKMVLFFEKFFNIKKSEHTYTVCFRLKNGEVIAKASERLGIAKEAWKERSDIRFRKTSFKVQLGGKLFRHLFGKIITYLFIHDLLKKRQNAISFLRGLFAAEGCIALVRKKEKYLANISFSLSLKKEEKLAELVSALLRKEKISSKIIKRKSKSFICIQITSWSNYWKLFSLGILSGCSRKKKVFMEHTRSMRFYFNITDSLKRKLKKINQRKFSLEYGISTSSICNQLMNKRVEKKVLKKMQKQMNLRENYVLRNTKAVSLSAGKTVINDPSFKEFAWKL